MKFCPNCGSEIKAGEKFCSSCGTMIMESEPLPEKEIFPEPGSKRKEAFGFGAGSSQNDFSFRDKPSGYDPFSGDEAPKYSDYQSEGYPKDDTGSRYTEGSDDSGYASSDYDFSETNGFAIAALILGIFALLFNFLLFIPSVLAVVFGIVGLKRSEQTGTGHGMSIAGIVLGIIAFSFYIIAIVCLVLFTGFALSL